MAPDVAQPLVAGKRVDDLATLAKNPLVAHLGVRELSLLLDLLDQVAVVSGAVLARQGDEGDYMYFVLEGHATVERSHVTLRALGPGDHFGERALIGVRRRAETVEATTTMRLARLSRARFASLAEHHPAAALHLLQAIVATLEEQLTTLTDHLGALLRERSLPRRAEVVVVRDGERLRAGTGEPVGAFVPQRTAAGLVVAGLLDRKPVSLATPILADATVAPLTTASWEGREIYRRSVGLVLLEAAHRVAPEVVLHLGPSIGCGQVAYLDADVDRADLAQRVARAMHTVVREAAPFREEIWTVEEARSHFAERGWTDAALLLRSWRSDTTSLVSCGYAYALRAGPLLPSTALVAPFDVRVHPDGLLLDFGEPVRAHLPTLRGAAVDPSATEVEAPRFGGEMERAHRRWLASLDVTSVGSFNELCVSGQVSQLVRVSEGFHEKRISRIADTIAQRRGVRVICIAGPSSSGKTTFIKRLTVQLEVDGVHPKMISLDDYYVDREKTARDEHGEYDFEAFEAIDGALLRDHVARLLGGEAVRTARFDFLTGKSAPSGGPELRLGAGDVLLVEGIHGLNPALLEGAAPREARFGIFIHPATTLPFDRLARPSPEDVRFLRRIVRDRHQRGYTAADSIARWPSVRRGDELYIYPHRAEADVVFDSSLVYELSVLKVYAERYLLEVPEAHPSFATAHRLRHLIDRFVAIYPDHVPPTSIAREFIGGSGFEY